MTDSSVASYLARRNIGEAPVTIIRDLVGVPKSAWRREVEANPEGLGFDDPSPTSQ